MESLCLLIASPGTLLDDVAFSQASFLRGKLKSMPLCRLMLLLKNKGILKSQDGTAVQQSRRRALGGLIPKGRALKVARQAGPSG